MNTANKAAFALYYPLQASRTGGYLRGYAVREMKEDSSRFDLVNVDWKNSDLSNSDLHFASNLRGG